MTVTPATSPRALPRITEMNAHFWCGGADGQLHILRCGACGTWIHPYAARCPSCRSADVAPQPVSGRGTVVGFTINVQPWLPGVKVPYVVAMVQLDEQADIRLLTNLPRTPIEEVSVGCRVKVYFEQHDKIFLPLFEAE
ncbi:Zn-ribbon domain-containing OB-fold protein [Novosphingobium bradum]